MEELLMKSGDIDTPFSPIVYEDFKRDRKLIPFDKHSKYLIKIISQGAPDTKLFEYAESFYEAAHRITDFIVREKRPDIEKLDTLMNRIGGELLLVLATAAGARIGRTGDGFVRLEQLLPGALMMRSGLFGGG